MKSLIVEFRAALLSTLVLAIVCSGIYPLIIYGVGQLVFPAKANGSLIYDSKGELKGSSLIGQQFSADKYFHSRPSSAGTGDGNGYDAQNSSGSNLGPTSQKLADAIKQNVADYRSQNGLAADASVPADAVTASGSGLDPHISIENAQIQAPRVAKARNLDVEKVKTMIQEHTDKPSLGFLGEPGVNVVELNLALDSLH